MKPFIKPPVTPRPSERLCLQPPYLITQKATLENGHTQGPLVRPQPGGQPRQRPARPAGDGDHIGVPPQLLPERPAPPYGKGIAPALRNDVRPLRTRRTQNGRQRLRLGLASIRRPVDEMQPHTVGHAPLQRRIEAPLTKLLAPHHTNRAQPEEPPRGSGGTQMVGVGAAESDNRAPTRRHQIRDKLAPLVADQLRMDQIVPLEHQPNTDPPEPRVHNLLHRRGEPGLQIGQVKALHQSIVARPLPAAGAPRSPARAAPQASRPRTTAPGSAPASKPW